MYSIWYTDYMIYKIYVADGGIQSIDFRDLLVTLTKLYSYK